MHTCVVYLSVLCKYGEGRVVVVDQYRRPIL